MRRLFAVSTFVGLIAFPAFAAPAPQESWGKAGVSLAQYRQDLLECGLKGHYTDVSNTQDAKVLVDASRQLDTMQSTFVPNTTASSGSGPASTDVASQMGRICRDPAAYRLQCPSPAAVPGNIKHTLEAATAECLVQRGYLEVHADRRAAPRVAQASTRIGYPAARLSARYREAIPRAAAHQSAAQQH